MEVILNPKKLQSNLENTYAGGVLTVDSHTAGEPTRLVVDGVGPIPGDTMAAKLEYFRSHYDGLRRQLTREPRGHRDLLAAVLTEPATPESRFGLIYMDARRYPYLCGHATIGAVTTLIETEVLRLDAGSTAVWVDTPSGPLEARVYAESGRVRSVGLRMVPSFVFSVDRSLTVPGFGDYRVDLVCAGGFFVMVPAEQIGLSLEPANATRLIELGMAMIAAGNQQFEVHHPLRPEVTTIDVVEFYDTRGLGPGRGRSAVIYGEAHIDRSPCGTGTTAKMTLLHHRDALGLHAPYRNQGILGTAFEGRLVEAVMVGDLPGVVAEIRGSAHITGLHRFFVDPEDPFPEGFLLG